MISHPVSTQAIRVIKKGQEAAFEAALRDFFKRAKPIPGQLSVSVVRPLVGSTSQEWGILRTFESDRHRDDFDDGNEQHQECRRRERPGFGRKQHGGLRVLLKVKGRFLSRRY